MTEWLLLLSAGFIGGVLNSVAGGGSFVTFPALLLVGVPPVSANATNTFASCSGYLSGAYAFRRDLVACRDQLPRFLLSAVLGGVLGAWLLLRTPEALFREAIPWLLLFATVLFVAGGRLNRWLQRLAGRYPHAPQLGRVLLTLLLLAVCTYGGFFNAGLGIIALSVLALAGYRDIHTMNGLKLLISSAVSLVAVALFIAEGVIAWAAGSAVLAGALAGGYAAAHWSRRLPQRLIRGAVAVAGVAITGYYFHATYLAAPDLSG